MDQSKVEELAQYDPVSAGMIKELHRLSEQCQDEAAKTWLDFFITGILSTVGVEDFSPFLTPYAQAGENAGLIKGYEGVGDIAYVKVDGEKYGVWNCDNFIYRLRFLTTGNIAVGYPVSVFAHCMRLDVEEMGITVTTQTDDEPVQ